MLNKKKGQKRAFIRAYQNKLKEDKIEDSSIILFDLINTPFTNDQNELKGNSFILKESLYSCTQQFLMLRVLDFEFIEQINLAFGRPHKEIKHPLPLQWRKRLEEKHSIKALTFHNHLLWVKFLLYWFLVGHLSACYEWFKNILSFKNDQFKNQPYSYFHQLSKQNLPNEKNKGGYENNTIISWYAELSNRSENILTNVDIEQPIKINNKHVYGTKSPWPKLKSLNTFIRLIFWAVVFFFKSTIKLFQGQFIFPMMIREIMLAKLVHHLDSSRLPRRYFFHNSGFFFRPLWTYVAQNKGAQIILYYYSTSDLWLQTKKGDTNCYNPYHIMTWPEYWIWNEHQLNFLNRFLSYDFKYKIVGPIWFSSTSIESLKKLPKKGIAIFDIEPFRDSYQKKIWYPVDYYSFDLAKKFYGDLSEIASRNNINLFIKRKRFNENAHKGYLKLIDDLSKHKNIFHIDSSIAAKSLIEISSATITMSFSTTAIIANSLNYPSVFYDPTLKTVQNDPAAHGINIIQNKEVLEKWMIENINKIS